MNAHNSYISLGKQCGLSIVELMVTLVLSLFIILVTTAFYVNNKSTYRFIDNSSNVQESGRYAIHFLRETIANAGFPKLDTTINAFDTAQIVNNTAPNNSDAISVSYQATQDCLGTAVAGTVTSTFILNANNELTCNGTALISGIQNMQIEYAVDTDGDNVPNSYQDSTAVINWDQVVAIRLAILVASQGQVRDVASAETYQLLSTSITAPNDRFHRRVFTTTIPLRNNNKGV